MEPLAEIYILWSHQNLAIYVEQLHSNISMYASVLRRINI